MSYQRPPTLKGVNTRHMLEFSIVTHEDADRLAAKFEGNIVMESYAPISLPHAYIPDEDLRRLPKEDQDRLAATGVDFSKNTSGGLFFQEEINYLMSRGLTEEESVGAIIKGFLSLGIPDLPPSLQDEINHAVEVSKVLAM